MLRSATLRSVALYSTFFLFFCAGVENGVFLPSVVEYLHTIGIQREAVLGIILACFWLSCCISSKAVQFLVASSYNVQLLLLLCCVLYILSGFIYYFAPSLWAVIFSKIFSGLGCGALSAIKTDLAPNLSGEEFRALRRSLHLSAAVGFACSPVFSALSQVVSRSPAAVPSEPGVVVGGLFVVCALLSLLGFTNLARNLRLCRLRDTLALAYERKSAAKNYGATKANETEQSLEEEMSAESCSIIFSKEQVSTPQSSGSKGGTCCDLSCIVRKEECRRKGILTQSDELLEAAEDFMGPKARLPPLRISHIQQADLSRVSFSPASVSTPGDPFNETADAEISIVPQFTIVDKKAPSPCCNRNRTNWLCPQFLTGFMFGSLQTMLTPLTLYYFVYTTLENSVAQLILSIFGLLPLVLVKVQANVCKYIVAVGCTLGVSASAGLLLIGPGSLENAQTFAACILALGISCGVLFATCGSQSRGEFRLSEKQEGWLWCLGLVIGPLWTGSTVAQPKVMHSGHLIVLVLGLANCVL